MGLDVTKEVKEQAKLYAPKAKCFSGLSSDHIETLFNDWSFQMHATYGGLFRLINTHLYTDDTAFPQLIVIYKIVKK